jgi:hypothetical protein
MTEAQADQILLAAKNKPHMRWYFDSWQVSKEDSSGEKTTHQTTDTHGKKAC